MESTTFKNVSEVLRRVVRADGRVGGMQKYINQEVDVIVYENTEKGDVIVYENTEEGEEGN